MGASETLGYYESPGKEYPAQLADTLRVHGCFEVLNTAVAGMSLPGQIQLWENWVSRFKPDVVLIYPTPTIYLGTEAPRFSSLPRGTTTRPKAQFAFRILDRLQSKVEYPAFIQQRRIAKRIAFETSNKPEGWLFEKQPQDRLELLRAHLDSLVRSIRSRGALPVLATHAMRFQLPLSPQEQQLLSSWRQFTPRATETTLLSFETGAADVVRQLAKENGVPLVDLAAFMTGKPPLFADFTHFTDTGAAVAASHMAEAIVKAIPSNRWSTRSR
jgi:hypothetical protein